MCVMCIVLFYTLMEYNRLRRYNSTFTKYSLVSDRVIVCAACCWENDRLSRFWNISAISWEIFSHTEVKNRHFRLSILIVDPSGRMYSNISVIYASVKSTFSGVQFGSLVC